MFLIDGLDPEPLDAWLAGLALMPSWLPEERAPRQRLRYVPTPLADEDEARALLIRHGLLKGAIGTHHLRIATLLARSDAIGLEEYARQLEARAGEAGEGHALHELAAVARRAAVMVDA